MRMVIQNFLDSFSNLLVELAFIHHFWWKCFHRSIKISHRINADISYWQLWDKLLSYKLSVWTSTFVLFTQDYGWSEEKKSFAREFGTPTSAPAEQWGCASEVRMKSQSIDSYLKNFHSRELGNDIKTTALLARKWCSSSSGVTWTLLHLWFLHVSLVFPGQKMHAASCVCAN